MASRPVIVLIGLGSHDGAALREYLERRGYDVAEIANGWEADAIFVGNTIDVAVSDLASGADGFELLRRHGSDGPLFIMLCGADQMIEKVLALELGAADVVERTVSARELAARIAGLLSRRGRMAPDLLLLENSTVDLRASLVMHRTGEEEVLSPGQVAMLRLFAMNPRKVLTREQIMAAAPAEATEAFDRSIDSRIVRLRRKLDTEAIATIRGAGYRFDPPAGSG